jgi:hypothetical protein
MVNSLAEHDVEDRSRDDSVSSFGFLWGLGEPGLRSHASKPDTWQSVLIRVIRISSRESGCGQHLRTTEYLAFPLCSS